MKIHIFYYLITLILKNWLDNYFRNNNVATIYKNNLIHRFFHLRNKNKEHEKEASTRFSNLMKDFNVTLFE